GTFPNTATGAASNAASVTDPGSITCQQPVLVIAKTPDGGTITAGQTATFTIVVTNTGTGTATGVAINDPLPNGATLTWQTGSPGCSIQGAGAAQTLSCPNIGTLAQGASSSPVVVTAATSVGNCPNL